MARRALRGSGTVREETVMHDRLVWLQGLTCHVLWLCACGCPRGRRVCGLRPHRYVTGCLAHARPSPVVRLGYGGSSGLSSVFKAGTRPCSQYSLLPCLPMLCVGSRSRALQRATSRDPGRARQYLGNFPCPLPLILMARAVQALVTVYANVVPTSGPCLCFFAGRCRAPHGAMLVAVARSPFSSS